MCLYLFKTVSRLIFFFFFVILSKKQCDIMKLNDLRENIKKCVTGSHFINYLFELFHVQILIMVENTPKIEY